MTDFAVLPMLLCPVCGAPSVDGTPRAPKCVTCGHRVPVAGGYLDLLQGTAHDDPPPTSPLQRLMESELVARVYERFWRPAFVRVVAGSGTRSLGGFTGEFFVHKHSLAMDDREGPWLDLSCGPGLFTRAMAAAAPGASIVGLDISKAMLEVAARRAAGYANVAFVRADAQDLPFADSSFGGINNAGALHVYDDPEAVFSGLMRVLQPGGVYVGSTYAPSPRMSRRIAARIAGIRRFDPNELRAWLSRVGFADYEDLRLGDIFVFRARKP